MNLELVIPLIVIIITTVAQIILIAIGKTDTAEKLEIKKQKAINKLTKRHKKTEQKFIKEEKKLNELKGAENNANT